MSEEQYVQKTQCATHVVMVERRGSPGRVSKSGGSVASTDGSAVTSFSVPQIAQRDIIA